MMASCAKGLNPYSNGILSEPLLFWYSWRLSRLNPYSNGILSETGCTATSIEWKSVLILILMEYSLRTSCRRQANFTKSLNPYSNGILSELEAILTSDED